MIFCEKFMNRSKINVPMEFYQLDVQNFSVFINHTLSDSKFEPNKTVCLGMNIGEKTFVYFKRTYKG